MFVKGLKCRECGKEYPDSPLYVCDYCFGPLEVNYDYDKIKKEITVDKIRSREPNMWRYRELLPIKGEITIGKDVGYTPLVKADNLAKALGVKKLYIKNDSVNFPTLSFKDRVVSVAIAKAKEFGFKIVACASTGNLANSVAALTASAGYESYVFIPSNLEIGKVLGTLIYDTNLIKINGSYDRVNRLCTEIAGKHDWAFVNINLRPYYAEGSKSLTFEMIEQLGFKVPDNIVVPMAGGSLITKVGKAIDEFEYCGLLKERPKTKIFGAQAKGCNPITAAVKEKREFIKPVRTPDTIAKSLAIGNPADGYYASDLMNKTGGYGEDVTDEEIVEGMKLLAGTEGIFTETAGGVTVAVAKKLIDKGYINKSETTVLAITGNGLKTLEALTGKLKEPATIEPNLEEFEKVLAKIREKNN
ncbi:MAG TPA: threonine synthase [bacterium]|nr:threonine synthase [bacterium]